MRNLQTISYFSHDVDIVRKRSQHKANADGTALSDSNLRYLRSFLKHLERAHWEKSIKYLRKLSKSKLFLTAIARGGFIITDAAQLKRKEIINRVIEQINLRNKQHWLKDMSYHAYVNRVSNALFSEFRCDSVSAYFIIKNNKLRINRGWVQGWKPEATAKQMQR